MFKKGLYLDSNDQEEEEFDCKKFLLQELCGEKKIRRPRKPPSP